jgi:hypothetical protein
MMASLLVSLKVVSPLLGHNPKNFHLYHETEEHEKITRQTSLGWTA